MSRYSGRPPLILWPLVALWRLVSAILALVGRLVSIVLGGAFILVGAVLCLTVVGAVVGVPLIGFGFLLIVRGLF